MNGEKEKIKSNPTKKVSQGKASTASKGGTNSSEEKGSAVNHSAETDGVIESKPRKGKGTAFSILALLFVTTAAGGLAWYGWTHYLQPQQQRIQLLEESIDRQQELSNRLNNQQKSADEARTATEQLLESLSNNQQLIEQRLESHANRLRDLSGTSRDDWMLAEAKYLLRLASQHLLMERGTVGAQALLKSADEILTAIDDVDLFIVRQAVAKDLMALKLAPTVDREGIYLQLAALIDTVEKLPVIPLSPQRQVTPSAESAEPGHIADDKKWYSRLWFELRDTFVNLGQFIRIRHHDKPPEPLLSDEHKYHLAHNLRLMFEQSQSALLREQSEVYRQSLEQAKQWLNQYYAHYSKKDILVEEINQLQQQPIVQFLPDISGSLEQLTQYIDRYHKLTPEKPAKSVGETGKNKAATERPMVPPEDIVKSKGVAPILQDKVSQDEKENN